MATNKVPNNLEKLVIETIEETYNYKDPDDLQRLNQALTELNDYYNPKTRTSRSFVYNEDHVAVYLMKHFFVNFIKTRHLLLDIEQGGLFDDIVDKDYVDVLDFGCGPGSSSLSLFNFMARSGFLKNRDVELMGVDASDQFLRYFYKLHMDYYAILRAQHLDRVKGLFLYPKTKQTDVSDLDFFKNKRDLIMISNLLAEVDIDTRLSLIDKSVNLLDDHGILMIIEPGLQLPVNLLKTFLSRLNKHYPELNIYSSSFEALGQQCSAICNGFCSHNNGYIDISDKMGDFLDKYGIDLRSSLVYSYAVLTKQPLEVSAPNFSQYGNHESISHLIRTNKDHVRVNVLLHLVKKWGSDFFNNNHYKTATVCQGGSCNSKTRLRVLWDSANRENCKFYEDQVKERDEIFVKNALFSVKDVNVNARSDWVTKYQIIVDEESVITKIP